MCVEREREREREIGIETAAMSWALSKRGWRVVSSLQGAEPPSPFLNLMFSSGFELGTETWLLMISYPNKI